MNDIKIVFAIQYRESSIQYPVSSIKHQVSSIKYQVSNIENQVSRIIINNKKDNQHEQRINKNRI